MKIVITGATGFIGRAAVIQLARRSHKITALVRKPGSASDLPSKEVIWDSEKISDQNVLMQAIRGADAVINLAGEPIAGLRWTPKVKSRLRSSRIDGTQKIVEAIALLSQNERPKVLISGSATGFYGDRGDEALTEVSEGGKDFLAVLAQEWEKRAIRAESLGVRVVLLRTGVVLGGDGGALQKMQPVILGAGKQWMSWIHIEDIVRFIEFSIDHSEVSGPYNMVTANPVRNGEFTRKLASARHFPLTVSAPKTILKIVLGEMSSALLASCRALPDRAVEAGFNFKYATIDEALSQIYPEKDPLEQTLHFTQFVAKPIEEVFSYFSRAENLEEITPPWLNFHIVGKSTPEVAQNTLIDYRLKIHGVPASWQSKIERWKPNAEFVDMQTHGPYAKWHHTHRFEEVEGGTLVHDDVVYKVPGGRVGKALLGAFIRRDVSQIFAFRKKKIAEVFQS